MFMTSENKTWSSSGPSASTSSGCQSDRSFFNKKWAIRCLFLFILGLFKQTIQLLQQINVKKCPSSILHQDANSWPDYESPPLKAIRSEFLSDGSMAWETVISRNRNKMKKLSSSLFPGPMTMATAKPVKRGQRLRRWRRAVWPDDGIKKWPNFGQKVATHFLHNSGIIRNSPKSHQNIWTTFVRQIVAKKLKKSPNLVTLTPWENAKLLGRSWQNCFVIENWTKFYRIYLTAVTDRKLDRLA